MTKAKDKVKKNRTCSESDEWEDVEDIDDDKQICDKLNEISVKQSRLELPREQWCKCGYCDVMPINKECLCCTEVDDIKFKKLSKGLLL